MNKFIIAIIFFFIPVSVSAESYLCIADKSIGYIFDKKAKVWNQTTFNVEDRKYVFKKRPPGTSEVNPYLWLMMKIGEKYATTFCESDFNEKGILICNKIEPRLQIDKKSLQYMLTFTVGYILRPEDAEKGDLRPYMEIGKCSKLD